MVLQGHRDDRRLASLVILAVGRISHADIDIELGLIFRIRSGRAEVVHGLDREQDGCDVAGGRVAGLAETIRGLDTTYVVFTGLEIDVRMAGTARATCRVTVGQIGFGGNGAGLTVSRGFVDRGAVGMALGAVPDDYWDIPPRRSHAACFGKLPHRYPETACRCGCCG